jgi:hypothetical protein
MKLALKYTKIQYIKNSKAYLISGQYKPNQDILLLFTWGGGTDMLWKNAVKYEYPEKRVQIPLY